MWPRHAKMLLERVAALVHCFSEVFTEDQLHYWDFGFGFIDISSLGREKENLFWLRVVNSFSQLGVLVFDLPLFVANSLKIGRRFFGLSNEYCEILTNSCRKNVKFQENIHLYLDIMYSLMANKTALFSEFSQKMNDNLVWFWNCLFDRRRTCVSSGSFLPVEQLLSGYLRIYREISERINDRVL